MRFLSDREGIAVTPAETMDEALAYAEAGDFDDLVLRATSTDCLALLEKVPPAMLERLTVYSYPYSGPDRSAYVTDVVTVDSVASLADLLRPIPRRSPETSLVVRPPSESGDGSPLADKRILVVEDDVRNVFALTNALENEGMNVLFAENGTEALDVLYRNPDVDLILMDIMMPGLDGYETTQAIRSRAQFADLPIIALTAKAMVGDREKTLAAGATEYIAKPVDVGELLTKIRSCLSGPA
jgi:CheY-like chemotaxis protein